MKKVWVIGLIGAVLVAGVMVGVWAEVARRERLRASVDQLAGGLRQATAELCRRSRRASLPTRATLRGINPYLFEVCERYDLAVTYETRGARDFYLIISPRSMACEILVDAKGKYAQVEMIRPSGLYSARIADESLLPVKDPEAIRWKWHWDPRPVGVDRPTENGSPGQHEAPQGGGGAKG